MIREPIQIERMLSGGFLIAQRDKRGELLKMRYMDYSKCEALRLFRADFKAHQNKAAR